MTAQHKRPRWMGLLCLCFWCLFVPPTASAQSSPQKATLAELLTLTKQLVTDSGPLWPTGVVDIGSDESPRVIYTDGNELVRIFSTIGFTENEEIDPSARMPSVNPDIRRIARFIKCDVFHIAYYHGRYIALSGEIDRQGDERVPEKWFAGPALDGSALSYQGVLLLSPMGLLSQEQVDAVIAALKASGLSEQPRAAGGRIEIIRTFAEEVHGAEDSCNTAPDATTESIIFDGKRLPDPNGAQIIVSQEAPGRFALFVLMGGADFTQDRERMCR